MKDLVCGIGAILMLISLVIAFTALYYSIWAITASNKLCYNRRLARKNGIIKERHRMYRYYRYRLYVSDKNFLKYAYATIIVFAVGLGLIILSSKI